VQLLKCGNAFTLVSDIDEEKRVQLTWKFFRLNLQLSRIFSIICLLLFVILFITFPLLSTLSPIKQEAYLPQRKRAMRVWEPTA